MGTYCTTTSLDTLMIGTTFDTATTALGDKCITWAEDEINKHLSERYDVSAFTPSASVPPMVRSLCEQLSMGYMYDAMSRSGKESHTRAERFIDRVMINLSDLVNNKADLVNTAGSSLSELSTRKGVLSNTEDYHTTFDEDDPLDWVIDSDKLNDIESGRN